jgi:hypothetical protein
MCHAPTNKGGLKFYCTGVRVGVQDADATDYVNTMTLYGMNHTGRTQIQQDGTNLTSQQSKSYSWAAEDVSGYEAILIDLHVIITTSAELKLSSVEVLGYYAA